MLKPTHPAAVADAGPADEPLDPGWLLGIPRIARAFLPPMVALGERAECELCDEDRAGVVETLHDGRFVVERLVLVEAGAPRRWIALHREQILRAPGDAVQRTAIFAARDLRVHLLGLFARARSSVRLTTKCSCGS